MAALIETLDITKNSPYDDYFGTIGIKCQNAYTSKIEFNTTIDTHFTGHEQRRDAWTTPRRTWVLEFRKTLQNWKAMEEFFIRKRGAFKSFYWTWPSKMDGENFGGDDKQYLVRFNSDILDLSVLELGYATFSVEIIEVKTWEGGTP